VTPPVIRPARLLEAPALTAIAHAAKRRWGYPEAWIAAWSQGLTIAPAMIDAHTVLVAEVGGEVRGVAVLADRQSYWSLEHLWVDPAAQGQGIGRALFEAVTDAAGRRRGGVVRVESDPHAVGFYERMGARHAGSVPAPVLGTDRELPVLELDVPAIILPTPTK
jgi:ribosomal protein S18 acetylase RimI-like enzyme